MVLLAVFLVSLSSLAYEVLLTRFFSFFQWNHLSFMVISIVLFGFGASGSALSALEARRPGWVLASMPSRLLAPLLLLFCLSAGGSFLAVKSLPLDYFRMPLDWRQAGYLAATFLLLFLPFFCAGSVLSLAFSRMPERSGWIYAASMLGSAAGALLPSVFLPLLGEGRAILLVALFPLGVPLLELRPRSPRPAAMRRLAAPACALLLVVAALPLLLYRGGSWLQVRPSPYKLLAQVLQFPDSRILGTEDTLRGRLDRVQTPYLRFGPGLSLKLPGQLPPQSFVLRDGDTPYVAYHGTGPEALAVPALAFSGFSHSAAAYALSSRAAGRRVLILLQSGGLSVAAALRSGSREVTVVVDQPGIAELLRHGYRAFMARPSPGGRGAGPPPPGESSQRGALSVVTGDARGWLARAAGGYDVIQLESWGPSIPGMASLEQEHLLTVEALQTYLGLLSPGGLFTVSRRLLLPPSDCLRLFASAFSALKRSGISAPAKHLALIRGWDSYTLLLSRSPFGAGRLAELKAFCRELDFDLLFYAGMGEEEANLYNRFPEPFHFRELRKLQQALEAGREAAYFRAYYLDIRPATDDRPFHSRFTRWLRIGALYRVTGSRLYSLLLSGETVVLAVLAIVLVLGALLLLLPRLAGRGPGLRGGGMLYFLAAGAGYMFVEMAFLQLYTLAFGHPVVALAAVLAGLLVFSGLGSAAAARWQRRPLRLVLLFLVPALAALAAAGGPAARALAALPSAARLACATLLLLPAGLLMGVPFPVGLRLLAGDPGSRAYAWGANGVASVVASVVALPLAMAWGISRLFLLAALCYGAALGVLQLSLAGTALAGTVPAGTARGPAPRGSAGKAPARRTALRRRAGPAP
jgi:hypothetical protein